MGHVAEQSVGVGGAVLVLANPPAGAYKVLIQALDFAISLRDDGTPATAGTGLVIAAGDIYVLEADRATLLNVSAIGIGGTARVRVAYYGQGG